MNVSVVIPTKNGESTLQQCLRAVFSQNVAFSFDVTAVDSGSADHTLDVLRHFGVRTFHIPRNSFSHGLARNFGARRSIGDPIVFLNQDAIPADVNWLDLLVQPFQDPRVAASYSRQIPRRRTNAAEKAVMNRMYPCESKIHLPDSLAERGPASLVLFSTASGALRRNIWERYGFAEDIVMSEDQQLATRVLKDGYRIAYQSLSKVTHSHNYSVAREFRRYFDSGWSMNYSAELKRINYGKALTDCLAFLGDVLAFAREEGFRESIIAGVHAASMTVGFVLGLTAPLLPKSLRDRISHTIGKTRG